ncbi:hypothetical protein HY312_02380 [Candidatus Saccharibacteria bacterium]|nr:hypothetical protein [Candidatus Saccharibacteria bacterium]
MSVGNADQYHYFNASDVALQIELFTPSHFDRGLSQMRHSLRESGRFFAILQDIFAVLWEDISVDLRHRVNILGLAPNAALVS